MYRGDDIAFRVRVRDKTTLEPTDIRGWNLRTTMKRAPTDDDDDASAPVKVDSGVLADAAAQIGIYWLRLPNAQTRNLGPGLYYIDIEREQSGVIVTVIYGRVRVTSDITRRAA